MAERYVDILEKDLRAHKIPQQIREVAASSAHKAVVKEKTDAIDKEKAQYRKGAEK